MRRVLLFIIFSLFYFFSLNIKTSEATIQVNTSCKGCVLMEAHSKRPLYQKNAHQQMYIASITKIMTAIIAIEEGHLNEYVTISSEATKQVGSSIYLSAGEQIKLVDLIYGLMLRSGNDAAVAISEHVAGDVESFVYLMNEKAKQLGMHNTIFENPSGLDEKTVNLSTAYDMALLMSYAINNPIFQKINQTETHRCTSKDGRIFVFKNKHRLIGRYDFITGGKTGYTKKANRTLVTSAHKNGLDLVVVTLDDPNDWDDHLDLFNYGFSQYENYELIKKGIIYAEGLEKIFNLSGNIIYPLTRSELEEIEFVIDKENEQYYLRLLLNNRILLSTEIEEYNYLHDEVVDPPIYRRIKELLGEVLW